MSEAKSFRLTAWFYRAALAGLMGCTIWIYFAIARQTGPMSPPLVRDYTERLAGGHASLSIAPAPALLALSNPYDPAANAGLRLMDASLYRERYYLYFGITPFALVLVPWFGVTGHHLPTTYAAGIFLTGGFLAYALLLLDLRRRFFPGGARFATGLSILLIGWAGGQLSLVRLSDIHDVEIACAYFFVGVMFLGAGRALGSARPLRWLAVSGLALGLAVGARPSLVVAVPLLFAYGLWMPVAEAEPGRGRRLVVLFVPLALCGGALAVFNWMRFDNPLEFGVTYQLSTLDRVHQPTFLWERIPYAVHRYLLGGMRLGSYFPFIEGEAPGPLVRPASHDETSQLYGFFLTVPALLLLLLRPKQPIADRRGFRWLRILGIGTGLLQFFLMLPAGMGAYRYGGRKRGHALPFTHLT